MLSGGLDSTPVAALAARELASNGGSGRLHAVSYVFDELEGSDERLWMDALLTMYDIEAIRFPADGFWPLRDATTLPRDPNRPDGNPYRRMIQEAFARAREHGSRVVLSGWYGDHAYAGMADWLVDLLADGRWGEASRQLTYLARRFGFRAVVGSRGVRRVGRRVLDRIPVGRRVRPPWEPPRPAWLTEQAAALITEADAWPKMGAAGRRPDQAERLLGAQAAFGTSGGTIYAARAGVELWYPYRDRRLVEYMLAVPAHQLLGWGRPKHIVRTAMRGILPEMVRLREAPTSLMPLCARGLVEREWTTAQLYLRGPNTMWQEYVRPEWLWGFLPARIAALEDGAQAVVPWCCIALEMWQAGRKLCCAAGCTAQAIGVYSESGRLP
jgi:asparagine synthase (glutamine-hydrolysing)